MSVLILFCWFFFNDLSSGTQAKNNDYIGQQNIYQLQNVIAQFSSYNNSCFSHLTYDIHRNMLYAGATNRIYQLDLNLKLVKEAITGPVRDSPQCHAGGCSTDDIETSETNNHNKLLIYNNVGDTLIACGSIHQGACNIYYLSGQFPTSVKYMEVPLAANDEFSSTFAFIGPSKYQSWKKEDILYVGTTFTNVGDYRHDVPAIASRKLDDLGYAEFSIQQSNINIDVKYRDHYIVNYVYGFNNSEYAYFAVVQKKSHLADEAGFITRLARICVNDPNYDSYTEVTITCLADGEDYNILRDAKIVQAGVRLSQEFGIKKDDYVLLSVFSPSKEISSEPQNNSAMCIFTLVEIEEIFNENIHSCFNGSIKDRNLGYISGTINDGKCPVVGSIGNIFSFCHVGLKISGVMPIVARAHFNFPNVSITSVSTATAGPHTLAFLGTIDGWIRKVLLSGPSAGEYEKIEVDNGHKILPDTILSPKSDYLFVLSERRVTKMKIEHCNTFTNCSSCLDSRDPFCGWCSLEKRCTVRNECQKDTSTARWLSISTGQQCIDFEMVSPDKIPINQMTIVNLVIRTLPELPYNSKYKCVFGNASPIDANVTSDGIVCTTPPIDSRPVLNANSDHVLVPLSVRSSETNKDFVSRNFAFYDCSRHTNCRNCLRSKWNCNWCVYDNKCVSNSSTCRSSGSIVTDEISCPHFKRQSQLVLLPNKVPKEIKLEVENLPRPQSAHTGFLCTVNIEGAHMVLPARVESNKYVVCEKTLYSYEANTNEYEAKVDVNWNRNHYIDTVSIILYKCDILGSHRDHADCSLCVTRNKKYQCTWCNNQCAYNETCSYDTHLNECPKPRIDLIKPLSGPIEGGTLLTIEGSNLGIREEDVQGKIRIGHVPCHLVNYEISVKIECRTGAVSEELTASIKVGNEAGYTESSVQFQYKNIQLSGLYPTMGPQSGGTTVSIIGRYLNIGSKIAAFLDDYICHINITQASSGRLTCITSAARSPEHIRILTLSIDGANRTLKCSADSQPNSISRNNFHYHSYYETCSVYNYTVDPKILQIKPLKSFISGGRMMTVHGTNLDSIQKPEIEIYYEDERINKSVCTVLNANQMECPSPAVNMKFVSYIKHVEQMNRNIASFNQSRSKNRRSAITTESALLSTAKVLINYHSTDSLFSPTPFLQSEELHTTASLLHTTPTGLNSLLAMKLHENQVSFQLSFVMDNVLSVKNLNKHFQNLRSSIVYVEDPVYFAFPGFKKFYKGDTLVIEGENLNIASDESDVNVTIGIMQCNVTSLALTQLVCTPPEQQPLPTDENGERIEVNLPLVVVRVGQNLRFQIGYLKYEVMKPYTASHILFGIVIGTFCIVVSLIVILVIYRRKSTQAEREYKRIQIQMDTLESNVRMECKQAFAELQTDMTDLTADLENSGIPTLDHVNYIMKVFFPGVSDHPVLNSSKFRANMTRTNYDQAMIQFEQLLNNKAFLLIFIDTLEAQKSFSIRDKVNVASLLMIVFMNKMDYATDVLKSLLLRLIDKSVVSKHPQLMLRRTESVVEKMLTNYMAICMYEYLKDYSGNSLFLLYKAIKHQIEKGLVDAITHDARYSLSEERLLREQINHNVVTLHIIQDDLDEKIQCKVLDCDTITQVKSKILDALFKNTPFSMRPSVHELELEWRHGRGGHLTLQDEDLTTKMACGWKRINTLAHYGIKESAIMSLIIKQSDSFITFNKQSNTNCYYINNSSSHISINDDVIHQPPLQQNHLLNFQQQSQHHDARVYHLVKPIDDKTFIGNQQSSHERTHKAIPEIFLTRLLATKGTVQKFVDDFFGIILTVNSMLPPAVKWIFDILDEAATRHGITDSDVVHAWKSNSLPLRFWVNFIKNPDFIFDINKTPSVDACLNVIAQTFMDACSTTEYRLGKDSPSNKLLFAKDLPQYREMVTSFYTEIGRLPQISDQEMCTAMQRLSIQQQEEFDVIAALKELYIYVTKYRDQIIDSLDMDDYAKKVHLIHKLESVACTLEATEYLARAEEEGVGDDAEPTDD
ncbi:plexin-B isoform X2 [Sabethes cyaneus]|uniref:plexin-B isoform X2 n=1 Tax=Sabethes cyaneus TaxID=53552 RepID=UPI00237E4E08|nr:plexin-B isoform X2 [Sabethes cyaneus]